MPASNLLQLSPWMPNTPFQAYSCASEIVLSSAKLAHELSAVDNANFVHLLDTPEGVGEGADEPPDWIILDDLTGSVKLADCVFIVSSEAVFGFAGMFLIFA